MEIVKSLIFISLAVVLLFASIAEANFKAHHHEFIVWSHLISNIWTLLMNMSMKTYAYIIFMHADTSDESEETMWNTQQHYGQRNVSRSNACSQQRWYSRRQSY